MCCQLLSGATEKFLLYHRSQLQMFVAAKAKLALLSGWEDGISLLTHVCGRRQIALSSRKKKEVHAYA